MKSIRSIILILLLICAIIFFACKRHLHRDEFIGYIANPENGLTKSKIINNVEISVQYKPADLLLINEVSGKKSYKPEQIRNIKNKYHNHLYFTLSVSLDNKDILANPHIKNISFGDLINILSFRMNDYISLITSSKDTLKLMDYHFPRMYGMSRSSSLLIAFEKPDYNIDHFEFFLKDLGIGTGDVRMKFLIKDIKKIPLLTF